MDSKKEELVLTVVPGRPMMPRRKWRRREFRFPTKNVRVNGGAISGQLLNVARSGIAIETDTPIRIGGQYKLKMEFGDTSFVATATVRWCFLRRTRRNRWGDFAPVYHAGLSLEEQDSSDQEKVLDKVRSMLLAAPEE